VLDSHRKPPLPEGTIATPALPSSKHRRPQSRHEHLDTSFAYRSAPSAQRAGHRVCALDRRLPQPSAGSPVRVPRRLMGDIRSAAMPRRRF